MENLTQRWIQSGFFLQSQGTFFWFSEVIPPHHPHPPSCAPMITFTIWDIGQYVYCFSGCDVINFEYNLTFLIKLFFYMNKKSRQKFEYLENEKSF